MNSKRVLTARAAAFAVLVISRLARNLPSSPARQAILTGSLVCCVLTDVLDLYGALALRRNAWWPFGIALVLALGFVRVSFVGPERGVLTREAAA